MKIKRLPRLGHLQCQQNPCLCLLDAQVWLSRGGTSCAQWRRVLVLVIYCYGSPIDDPCWELGFPDTFGQTMSQLWGEKILCDPFLLLDVGQGVPVLAPSLCCSLSLRTPRPIHPLLTTANALLWLSLAFPGFIIILSREKQEEMDLHYFVRLQFLNFLHFIASIISSTRHT